MAVVIEPIISTRFNKGTTTTRTTSSRTSSGVIQPIISGRKTFTSPSKTTTATKTTPFKFDNTQIVKKLTAKKKLPEPYVPISQRLITTAKANRANNLIPKPATISQKKLSGKERNIKTFKFGLESLKSIPKTGGTSFVEALYTGAGITRLFDMAVYKALPDAFEPLRKRNEQINKQSDRNKQVITDKLELPRIREEGFQEQKAVGERRNKALGEAETRGQRYIEAVIYNTPQVMASMGLAIGSFAITKNPLLAGTIGFSTGFSLGASEVYNQAREYGLSDLEAVKWAKAGGLIIGAMDMATILTFVTRPFQAVFLRYFTSNFAKAFLELNVATQVESITEGGQEIVSNIIARAYGDNRGWFENVTQAYLVSLPFGLTGGVSGMLSNPKGGKTIEDVDEQVTNRINEIIEKPESERTANEQEVVDTMTEIYVTPQEATQKVVESKIQNTKEGKQVLKAVVQAKQRDGVIKIKFNDDGTIKNATVEDDFPALKPLEVGEIIQEESELTTEETKSIQDSLIEDDKKVYKVVFDKKIPDTSVGLGKAGTFITSSYNQAVQWGQIIQGDTNATPIAILEGTVEETPVFNDTKLQGGVVLQEARVKGDPFKGGKRLPYSSVEQQPTPKGTTQATKGMTIDEQITAYVDERKSKFRLKNDLDFEYPTSIIFSLPQVKGKEVMAYNSIKQIIDSKNMPIKTIEKEIIFNLLETPEYKNNKKINMKQFENDLAIEFLPVNVIKSTKYADSGQYATRMQNRNATTYIFNTPFEHGQAIYFETEFDLTVDRKDVEIRVIPKSLQNPTGDKYVVVKKGQTITKEDLENPENGNLSQKFFNLTETKKSAEAWIKGNTINVKDAYTGKTTKKIVKNKRGMLSHARAFDAKDKSNSLVVEIQAHPFQGKDESIRTEQYQKGIPFLNTVGEVGKIAKIQTRIEDLRQDIISRRENLKTAVVYKEGYDAGIKFIKSKNYDKEGFNNLGVIEFRELVRTKGEKIEKVYGVPHQILERMRTSDKRGSNYTDTSKKDWIKYANSQVTVYYSDKLIKERENGIKDLEKERAKSEKELAKLPTTQPKDEALFRSYRGIWHKRTIKEMIYIKAQEGFKTFSIPDLSTIPVIEGWSNANEDGDFIPYETQDGTDEDLTVGDEVDFDGTDFTVVKAEDRNITIAPSEKVSNFSRDDAMQEEIDGMMEEMRFGFEALEKDWGKIDTAGKALNVTRGYEYMRDLVGFNQKKRDIKIENERFEAIEEAIKEAKDAKKFREAELKKVISFKKLIESGVIEKEKLTFPPFKKNTVFGSNDDLETERADRRNKEMERLNKKYPEFKPSIDEDITLRKYVATGEWYRVINALEHEQDTLAVGEDYDYEHVKKWSLVRIDSSIEDLKVRLTDANNTINSAEAKHKETIKNINARKKPTDEQLANIPKKLLDEAKTATYPTYLGDESILLDELAPAESSETEIDDIDIERATEIIRERLGENYQEDYESMYGDGHVFYEHNAYDTQIWIVEEGVEPEIYGQPDQYIRPQDSEGFDMDAYGERNKKVLMLYKQTIIPDFKNLRKDNVEYTTTDSGLGIWTTKITEEDLNTPTAYRLKDKLDEAGLPITDKDEQEIVKFNNQFFGDTNVQIVGQILANKKALGAYSKRLIRIQNKQGKPKDTFYHEAVHKYMDVFLTREEHINLLQIAQKKYNITDITQIEERIAEDFIEYASNRETQAGKLKAFFDMLMKRLTIYSLNKDKIDALYDDILSGKANPTKPKRPKAPLVGTGDEPVGTKKASKVALSIEGKAIKDELIEEATDVAGFETININDQAERVAKLINEDIEKARAIVRGEEPLPSGLRGGMLIRGIEKEGFRTNNVEMIRELAVSPLVSETSIHAQELRTLAERDPYSPATIMRNIVIAKEKAFERRFKSKTKSQIVNEETKKIKRQVKSPSKGDWAGFLREIEC